MRRILLLATGDTIAYRPSASAVASGAELLADAHVAPAGISVEDVLAEPSWDTSPATMLTVARRVRTAIEDQGFSGVVVTHGTDTMTETALLTDLLAGQAAARGTIVFTGALDSAGSEHDGPRNLAAAVTAAADPVLRGAGALVCFAGELHAARWAALTDTTRPAAFSSWPRAALGRVGESGVVLTGDVPARPPLPGEHVETGVALIRTYPGMSAASLRSAADEGALGVVLEGTGKGNLAVDLFGTIEELTTWDIPVVLTSRAHFARQWHNGHEGHLAPDAGLATKVGAIAAPGLRAEHARVALMVALGARTSDSAVTTARTWLATL